jgi:hypothetical protein
LRANKNQMANTSQRSDGLVDGIRQKPDRVAPAPALDSAVKGRREKFGAILA